MDCMVSELVSSVTREVCVGTRSVPNEIYRENQCLIRLPSVLTFSRQTKANECSTILTICWYCLTSLCVVCFSSCYSSSPQQPAVVLLFRETWQCIKNIKSEPHVLHNLYHTLEAMPCSGTCVFWDRSPILSEQTLIQEIILFVFGSGHRLSWLLCSVVFLTASRQIAALCHVVSSFWTPCSEVLAS